MICKYVAEQYELFFRTVDELVFKKQRCFLLIALMSPAVCSECRLIKCPVDKILCDRVIKPTHIYSGAKLKLHGQF